MSFNEGDRIVRLEGYDHGGEIGVVDGRRAEDDPVFVYVLWDNGGRRYGSYPDRLKLLEKSTDYEVDE